MLLESKSPAVAGPAIVVQLMDLILSAVGKLELVVGVALAADGVVGSPPAGGVVGLLSTLLSSCASANSLLSLYGIIDPLQSSEPLFTKRRRGYLVAEIGRGFAIDW